MLYPTISACQTPLAMSPTCQVAIVETTRIIDVVGFIKKLLRSFARWFASVRKEWSDYTQENIAKHNSLSDDPRERYKALMPVIKLGLSFAAPTCPKCKEVIDITELNAEFLGSGMRYSQSKKRNVGYELWKMTYSCDSCGHRWQEEQRKSP